MNILNALTDLQIRLHNYGGHIVFGMDPVGIGGGQAFSLLSKL